MRVGVLKLSACCLASALAVTSIPQQAFASATAGITLTLQEKVEKTESENSRFAGISGILPTYMENITLQEKEVEMVTARAAEEEQEEKEEEQESLSEYANMAVANVNDYVNIRKKPTTESEAVGKLYEDCVATILDEKDGWYKIESGNVSGWVKGEYLIVGDAEAVKNAGTVVAVVNTETLRVREKASTESSIIGLVPVGEELTVMKEKDEWVKVSIEEGDGWVSKDYVILKIEFKYGESKAEEEARLKKEYEEKQKAAAAAQKKKQETNPSSVQNYTSADGNGVAVANYACQFVGNPYRYGGTSLTNGADCSGFVMSVYAQFGISLPHSSTSLRSVGYAVSTSEMKPGDIVCYSGHVAIYIGNNTIVHASNRSDGIKYTTPADYRRIITVRRIF